MAGDNGNGSGDGFDIDLGALPPHLQLKLWVLALDADTSQVNLAYRRGSFRTNLGYNYGGNVEATMAIRRFSASYSVNPGTGDMDLGVSFRGFNFGASASFGSSKFGLDFGYGAPLLPMPMTLFQTVSPFMGPTLQSTFTAGAGGVANVVRDLPGATNNPLQWYNMHSDDKSTIMQAVSAARKVQAAGSGPPFGIGLRLSHDPVMGLTIYGGAQYLF